MAKKQSDAEIVAAYISALQHPMKAEIEVLRDIIKSAHPEISERIKWNAPSYYCKEDMVTFGPLTRKPTEILLVFHHPAVETIQSAILQGNFKDRRLAIFRNMEEIEASRAEIVRVLKHCLAEIDAR